MKLTVKRRLVTFWIGFHAGMLTLAGLWLLGLGAPRGVDTMAQADARLWRGLGSAGLNTLAFSMLLFAAALIVVFEVFVQILAPRKPRRNRKPTDEP
jgi:hypothetical protein